MKKKALYILLGIIGIIIVGIILYNIVFSNSSNKVSKDGIIYSKDGVVHGIKHNDDSDAYDIMIPQNVGVVNLTEIAPNAFENCNISVIYIPTTITKIGKDAFKNTSINMAFYNGTITEWNDVILENENSTPMAFATNVYAFDGKEISKIENLHIPYDIKTINSYSFYGWPCSNIKVSEGITKIEKFGIVARLGYDLNITLPISLKEIEEVAIIPHVNSKITDDSISYGNELITIHYSGNGENWNEINMNDKSIINKKIYVYNSGVYELLESSN